MNLIQLIEDDYLINKSFNSDLTRLVYLSDYVFDFTTYDSYVSNLFATKALEACVAITNKTTFDYLESDENNWFLIMVNMPFFKNKIDWGTSIRGAWWRNENTQMDTFLGKSFPVTTNWEQFIEAIIEFAKKED